MRRGRILILVLLILIVGLVVAVYVFNQFIQRARRLKHQRSSVYVHPGTSGGVFGHRRMLTTAPSRKCGNCLHDRRACRPAQQQVASYREQGHILSVDADGPRVFACGPQHASLIPHGMTTYTIPTSRLKLGGYGVGDGSHVNMIVCVLFADLDPTLQSVLPNNTAVLTGTGFVPESLPVLSMSVSPGGPHGRLELDPSVQQPFFLIPSEGQNPRPVCQMLLQDVVVLRGNSSAAAGQAQPGLRPDIVTVIVTPQDAVMLAYLTYTQAELTLAQRNPSDLGRQATEPAVLQFLLSQYNIPVPGKLPFGMRPPTFDLVEPSLPNDTVTVQPE
jgi:hypothetical protein